jgi:hypothetical protein
MRSAGPMSSRCFCHRSPSLVTRPVPRMGMKGLYDRARSLAYTCRQGGAGRRWARG